MAAAGLQCMRSPCGGLLPLELLLWSAIGDTKLLAEAGCWQLQRCCCCAAVTAVAALTAAALIAVTAAAAAASGDGAGDDVQSQ